VARRPPRDPDVPRIPRGKGFKLSFGELLRIALTASMLVLVLVTAKPCSEAVGRFVGTFEPPDAQVAVPDPPPQQVPAGYVHLTPNMTPEQIQQAINAARDAGAAAPAPAPDAAQAPDARP
jgi:hypothetical protein